MWVSVVKFSLLRSGADSLIAAFDYKVTIDIKSVKFILLIKNYPFELASFKIF